MIESNKLMADFLGWDYREAGDYWYNPYKGTTNHTLLFHLDWNWLMLVLDKVKKSGGYYTINNKLLTFDDTWFKCVIRVYNEEKGNKNYYTSSESLIQAVYSACLQFIQNESNS